MRRAFTLIELLVAIAIIAVLMALIVPTAGILRDRARQLLTTQRIEAFTTALARLGDAEGSSAYLLQRELPLAGSKDFYRAKTSAASTPDDPDTAAVESWHRCFPDLAGSAPGNPVVPVAAPGNPLVMAYPWGAPRSYWIREAWYTGPLGLQAGDPDGWSVAERTAWGAREPHRLHELWPRLSGAFAVRAGLARDLAEYASDRSTQRAWNDAWGNPLVLAYAVYQPPECRMAVGQPQLAASFPADWYLKSAMRLHGYNRAIYLTAGSAGPDLDASLPLTLPAVDGAILATLWNQICTTVMEDDATTWDERSSERPPWSGVKRTQRDVGSRRSTCFLSAPIELK